MDGLLYFNFLLDRALEAPTERLKTLIPSSPPLRSHFVRLPQDRTTTRIQCRTKGTIGRTRQASKFLYLVGVLWDKEQRFLHQITNVMDELDATLRETSQKTLLSSFVAETISDISILAESIRQLRLYQPWGSNMEFGSTEHNKEFQAQHEKSIYQLRKFLEAKKPISLAELGRPSQGFFHYPIDKSRTRDNIEAMRKAEYNLDAFWHYIDTETARKDPDLHGFRMPASVRGGRQLQRTPE